MVVFAKPCVDRITNSAKMHRFLSNFIQIHSNLAQICKTKIWTKFEWIWMKFERTMCKGNQFRDIKHPGHDNWRCQNVWLSFNSSKHVINVHVAIVIRQKWKGLATGKHQMIDNHRLFQRGFVSAFFLLSSCHMSPVPIRRWTTTLFKVVQRRAQSLATPFYAVPATICQVQARLGLVFVAL